MSAALSGRWLAGDPTLGGLNPISDARAAHSCQVCYRATAVASISNQSPINLQCGESFELR
eukprot:603181-Pyramimonas_sp.AAC.1